MRQAGPQVVARTVQENLRFVFQTAERAAVENTVAVPLKIGAERVADFRITASRRFVVPDCKRCEVGFLAGALNGKITDHGTVPVQSSPGR